MNESNEAMLVAVVVETLLTGDFFCSYSTVGLFVDERTHVELGVSAEASGPSYPALPPEASSHSASVPDVNPPPQDQTLQNQTSPMDLGPQSTEGEV